MCAHAVRVAVEKLPGVEAVEVSLNEGYATVWLLPQNTVRVDQVRRLVRDKGFTPRAAAVRVRGVISVEGGGPRMTVGGSGEVLGLTATGPVMIDLRAAMTGQTVQLEGEVAESESPRGTLLLRVDTVRVEDAGSASP